MPDDFLTVVEVAELLKVSEKTVRRLAARGEVPSFHVGAQRRFRRADIEAWIDAQQAPTPRPHSGT